MLVGDTRPQKANTKAQKPTTARAWFGNCFRLKAFEGAKWNPSVFCGHKGLLEAHPVSFKEALNK